MRNNYFLDLNFLLLRAYSSLKIALIAQISSAIKSLATNNKGNNFIKCYRANQQYTIDLYKIEACITFEGEQNIYKWIVIQQMGDSNTNKKSKEFVEKLVLKSVNKIYTQIERSERDVLFRQKPNYALADATPEKIQYQVEKQQVLLQETQNSANHQSKTIRNQSKVVSNSKQKHKSKDDDRELSEKAQQFIKKIRNRKKEVEGKFHLKKIAQEQRKKEERRKKDIEEKLQKEIDKQLRKLRAEKNIQFFQKKQKLYFRNSISQSPVRPRAPSTVQTIQTKRNQLPSIYSSQLQQIYEQSFHKKEATNLTRKRKNKRSNTEAAIRDEDDEAEEMSGKKQRTQRLSSEIQLFNLKAKQKVKSTRDEWNREKYGQGRKRYLMNKNQKTEDISVYLDKFSNLEQVKGNKTAKLNLIGRNTKLNSGMSEKESRYNRIELHTLNQSKYQNSEDQYQYQEYQN